MRGGLIEVDVVKIVSEVAYVNGSFVKLEGGFIKMYKQWLSYYLFLIKLDRVCIKLVVLLAFIQSSRGCLKLFENRLE
jgi:hypothetical protein